MTDQADPTFVNTLQVSGFLNGVINLAFSTAKWYPHFDPVANKAIVAVSEPITVDLRMDLATAQAVRDALDQIIAQNTKPTGPAN
jgi:hypothetical protein